MDAHQATGLADTAAFVDMLEHGEDLLLREHRAE
jgi:hypothetical protein